MHSFYRAIPRGRAANSGTTAIGSRAGTSVSVTVRTSGVIRRFTAFPLRLRDALLVLRKEKLRQFSCRVGRFAFMQNLPDAHEQEASEHFPNIRSENPHSLGALRTRPSLDPSIMKLSTSNRTENYLTRISKKNSIGIGSVRARELRQPASGRPPFSVPTIPPGVAASKFSENFQTFLTTGIKKIAATFFYWRGSGLPFNCGTLFGERGATESLCRDSPALSATRPPAPSAKQRVTCCQFRRLSTSSR